jgi:ribosomal protein S16
MQRSRGKFIEKLGFYNPHFTERRLEIDAERLAY